MSKGFLTSQGVIVAALSLSLVGCGQFGRLQASKHFKDANALYAQQDYRGAAVEYKGAIEADPSLNEAYFFLANSYDNLYKPARKGNALNDSYLQDALKNYKIASEKLIDDKPETKLLRKRTLQFMAALYAKDKLNQPDEAEPVVKQLIAMEPNDTGSYFALVRIYEEAGKVEDAEEILKQAQAAAPDKTEVWSTSAQFYNRKGEFDRAMESFQRITQLEPKNPQNFYQMAVFYEEKVRKDFTIKPAQQADYLNKGMEAVDKALELRPDYFEALTYKNLILRQQASKVEKNPAKQQELLKKADEFQKKAIDIQKLQRGAPAAAAAAGAKK
ncbi:MAG: tetratricopeptide repeat protein [Vicinamibacterales bacterium]